MIKEATQILSEHKNLSVSQMEAVMQEIMTGKVDTPQIVSFLTALNQQGETAEELAAAVKVMRHHATRVETKHKVILDTCGTGGDKKHTFNISTAVAFVAAGAGIAVAKHGNRSVSSKSGSADILEAAGININITKERVEQCLDDIGIAFLFAQRFHPAMKYAMPARKEIGARTIFNFLGPLSNPAGATHQLLGVYDSQWAHILAYALANLGIEHALVVHGQDKMDEISTMTQTSVWEVRRSKVEEYQISYQDFGIKPARLSDLSGGSAVDNARILWDVLNGKSGPVRDIVVLNAAAAIYVANQAASIKDGIALAEESIDSKQAKAKLELLKEFSNQ
ncbi:MAG: anthranilate phosphoribosyltransferase [Candidatus Omnitrophota bacterium]|jgi:anthranilate phosphoribosyltransferase